MSDALPPSPSTPTPRPAAKPTNGCLVATGVLLGLVVLCTCTGAGVMSYVVYTKPELRRGIAAVGDAVTLAENGMKDPGARAMVQAGCQQALAVPFRDAVALAARVAAPDAGVTFPEDAPELVVSCSLRDTMQTCDELARVFVSAHVPPPSRFVLVVDAFPGSRRVCSNVYGSTGELLAPFDTSVRRDRPNGPASPDARVPSK